MFEDVMDDFHDLDQIKSRFEDWRNKHSESYNEAYIGLCLPKLFTPFVKLGLITWNPLQVTQSRVLWRIVSNMFCLISSVQVVSHTNSINSDEANCLIIVLIEIVYSD